MRKLKNRGFTLLELLIVVVVLGILATIAVPRITRGTEVARQAEARAILGHIYQAERMYFTEHEIYTDNLANLFADVPANNSTENYFKYLTEDGTLDGTFTADALRVKATRKTITETAGTPAVKDSTGNVIEPAKAGTGRQPGWAKAYTITIDKNGVYEVVGF